MKRFTKILSAALAAVTLLLSACAADPGDAPDGTSLDTEAPGTTEPSCPHEFSEWENTGKYTCDSREIYTRSCRLCGENEEEYREIVIDPSALPETVSLDGKKVLFLGNSMIYYGNCVVKGSQGSDDPGYFAQLCKAHGEKTTVIDCTYGNHGLSDFAGACTVSGCGGTDHLSKYHLDTYDYVVMCQVTNRTDIVDVCNKIKKRFTNPKTKFIYLCCTYTYQQNYSAMIACMPKLQEAGYTVVNFGELCYNVWKGNEKVPGAAQTYNKNSFIINGNDANHPNMLTGYIEALMVYSAITGRSAVGMPYGFVTDTKINSKFNAASFISSYYTKGTTNFDKILASPADMNGLQQLIDKYNDKWGSGCGYVLPSGSHLYDRSDTVFAGSSNTCALGASVCRYCGKTLINETIGTDKTRTDVMLHNAKPGVSLCSEVKNAAAVYDCVCSCEKDDGGKEKALFCRVSGNTKYSADGNVTSDGSYTAIIEFCLEKEADVCGFALFGDGSLKEYDLVGGYDGGDGNVNWKVLASGSSETLLGGSTRFDEKTFDTEKVNRVRICVKSSDAVFRISEIELYSKK